MGRLKHTTEMFSEKAKIIHQNFYNYSESVYTGNDKQIKIICPIHGPFMQRASHHLNGKGCSGCMADKVSIQKKKPSDVFFFQCKEKHDDFYDYSSSIYLGKLKHMNVKCPTHGEFSIRADNHLKGSGCKECFLIQNRERQKMDISVFISRSSIIHKNKYNYSLVNYTNLESNVFIICPQHGKFSQRAGVHLSGSGCPKCSCFSKGEKKISEYFIERGISFEYQKTYNEFINPITGAKYKFDFYLPMEDVLIEFDGLHHFIPIEYWGGEEYFKKIQYKDNLKNDFCKNNNIKLIRISYKEDIIEKLDEIFLK